MAIECQNAAELLSIVRDACACKLFLAPVWVFMRPRGPVMSVIWRQRPSDHVIEQA